MWPEIIGAFAAVVTVLATIAAGVFRLGWTARDLRSLADKAEDRDKRVDAAIQRANSDIQDLLRTKAKQEGREEARQQSSHDLDKFRRDP